MRKFIDVLKGQIQTEMPDNDQALVKVANVRNLMTDMADSLKQDEAGLFNATPVTSMTFNLTDSWVKIDDVLDAPVVAYDSQIGDDGDFLKINAAQGIITTKDEPGWSYEALGAITVDASNNEVIEAAIGIDGAPGDLVGSNVGSAGSREESIFLRRYIPSTPANSQFSIILRAPDGAASNVTISTRTFGVIILPTNNP